jgi:hypothetical protein
MDFKQLQKLNQLNALRAKRFEKELSESKAILLKACNKVNKRDDEIKNINKENSELNQYSSNKDVTRSPTKREHVHIRKFWLNYDLEMHEYYYNQEVEDKNKAVINHNKTKHLWYKQKLKCGMISSLSKSSNNEINALKEDKEDEENQEYCIK